MPVHTGYSLGVRVSVLLICLALGLLPGAGPPRADDAFEIIELASSGRTSAAELVDLNGDGRTDLLQAAFVSFPPNEERWVRVYLQGPEGGLPAEPSRVWRLPPGVAAYDVGDVLPTPGSELLLLRAHDLLVVSFAGEQTQVHEVPVPGVSLAAAEDERGLDRMRIVWHVRPDEPWLMLPMAGALIALSPEGELRARFETGTRANYLVPPRPGPVFVESELQVFLDVPVLALGDVDGDGRPDIVASSRHEVRLFHQRDGGAFPSQPDRVIALARVSQRDHLRGTGAVRAVFRDLNGDGLLDAVVSHSSGGLTDAETRTTLHLNRGSGWDLETPDQSFESTRAWTADQLVDLDGDGRPELLRIRIPITVLEMVEMLLTRAVDAEIRVHRAGDDGLFEREPWIQRKLDIPFNLDTGRPRGFIPTVNADLNGDGLRDFLSSDGGKGIEVFLGGEKHRFGTRHSRQKLESSQGRVRFGDVNGDGLQDFVLYAPRVPGSPLRVVLNLGTLPGSPPRMVGSGPPDER